MNFGQQALAAAISNEQRPFVRFEYRAVEDRTIPATDGVSQLKDVAWAIIRAPGSKDSVEKLAEDWVAGLPQLARDGRIPASWPRDYREALTEWLKTGEIPVSGTAIKTWPPLRPAQREMLLNMGVLSVEQLAEANDEIINRLGMGGVASKQMAQNWLKEAKTSGTLVRELEVRTVRQKELETTVASLQAEVTRLAALIPKSPAK